MTRGAWLACAVWLSLVSAATPALADKVTLANGDVLHGDVNEDAGRVHLHHPVLGDLDLARSDVLWITRDGETSTGALVVACAADACPAAERPAAKTPEPCPSPWNFAVGVGFSNDAGNTDKIKLNADLEIGYRRGLNRVDWRSFGFYEEANDVQTEGKFSSRLIYRRDIRPRGRLFGAWFVDRDDFADIELRSAWFVGYEHDLVAAERTTLVGGIGVGGAVEKRAGEETITVPSLLAHLTYRHEFQGGDSLEGMAYVLPYLDYFERSPMHFELRYAHPLREHLDLTAGFLADYVVDPPTDTKSYDTKITFGLRWKR